MYLLHEITSLASAQRLSPEDFENLLRICIRHVGFPPFNLYTNENFFVYLNMWNISFLYGSTKSIISRFQRMGALSNLYN